MDDVFTTADVIVYTLRFYPEPFRVQLLTSGPYYQDGFFRLCRALLLHEILSMSRDGFHKPNPKPFSQAYGIESL